MAFLFMLYLIVVPSLRPRFRNHFIKPSVHLYVCLLVIIHNLMVKLRDAIKNSEIPSTVPLTASLLLISLNFYPGLNMHVTLVSVLLQIYPLLRHLLVNFPLISQPGIRDHSSLCPTSPAKCWQFWRQTNEALLKTKEQNRWLTGRHRASTPQFTVGQKVWLSTHDIPLKHTSRKLSCRFIRPYPIPDNQSFLYKTTPTVPSSFHIHSTFHVSQVKYFVEIPSESLCLPVFRNKRNSQTYGTILPGSSSASPVVVLRPVSLQQINWTCKIKTSTRKTDSPQNSSVNKPPRSSSPCQPPRRKPVRKKNHPFPPQNQQWTKRLFSLIARSWVQHYK